MDCFGRASSAGEETRKKTATEKMNLKITTAQIKCYSETQTMPTLQYLADELCEDSDMEYVTLKEKEQASLEKIEVGKTDSILTKLKEYPYEFEIDSDLKLASINGTKLANNDIPEGYILPSGTYDITENGEYNIAQYEKVNVSVNSGAATKSEYINSVDFTTKDDGLGTMEITASVDATTDQSKILCYLYFIVDASNSNNIKATSSNTNKGTITGLTRWI